MKSFTLWLKGLFAAALGGAAANATVLATDPSIYSGPAVGKRIGIVSGIGAAIAVAGYLKQSPVPASPVPNEEQK
jgi:hypothetical protein